MSNSLTVLLEHAERERDEALAALLRAEAETQALVLQAGQLTAYRDEARTRHPAHGGRSSSIELLRCHAGFMERLDQALTQLQGQVAGAEARGAARRVECLALETRVASVRKLMERRGAERDLQLQRQDQRRSDDAAQRRRGDDNGWSAPSRPMLS